MSNKIDKKEKNLVLSTKFTGLNIGPPDIGSVSADYASFYQTVSGTDAITGCDIDDARQGYFGAGAWKFQHLTDFLTGVNNSNTKAYSTAEFVPDLSKKEINNNLVITAKQRFNGAGGSSSPQSWLLMNRDMTGSVREPDIPELFYEFEVYLNESLMSTLLTSPTSAEWFSFFEIKTGMCNDGIGGPDTATAGDWRIMLMANKAPANEQMQFLVRMDDGANSAGFVIPGVSTGGAPKRCIREKITPLFLLNEWYKIQIYIKRPANNADRTSGRCYMSATPLSTGNEIVLAKWIGGEQMGVQSGPLERFFLGIYSGGNVPYSVKFRNYNIYKAWIRDDDPFAAAASYNDASFYAPLTHSLIPTHAFEVLNFSRTTTGTVIDNEGKLLELPINVPRFTGARYVRNLFTSTTSLATQGITVEAGRTYTVSFYDTGTISFTGAYTGSNLVGIAYGSRVQRTFTAASNGTVTCTVTGTCRNAQFEDVTGQADQTASEYVSNGALTGTYTFYKHGLIVDGIKAFNTNKNLSTISDSNLKGLVINGASRTNTALYSRDMTNSLWVKSNMTATLDQIGLDGKLNACSKITATSNNGTILQSISAAASAGCLSMYIKRSSGTGTVEITRNNGTTWTDVTSLINSSTFTRVSIENTSILNPTIGIRLGTSGNAVIVDCIQNELGGDVSLPIHTTSASVTRTADLPKFYEAGNTKTKTDSISSAGLWLLTVNKENWQVEHGSIMGNTTSGIFTSNSNSGVIVKDGTNTVNGPTGTPTGNATKILGMKYSGSSLSAYSDGVWSSAGSFDGTMSDTTFVDLGKSCTCTIKKVAVWNQYYPSDSDIILLTQ